MALTGRAVLVVLIAVTFAAFGTVVVVWPRWSGRSIGRVTGRVALLLGVNVLVLLTAVTAFNDAFGFFADWTDLTGAMGVSPQYTTSHHGTTAAAAATRPVSGSAAVAPATLPPLPAGVGPGHRVLHFMVTGARSGIRAAVDVELPPDYTDRVAAARRYPVLETFQGYPSEPTLWINTMDLGGTMNAAVQAHRMGEAIIVSPSIEIPPGVDTECVNGGQGTPQVETWVTQDVPDWVEHTFRVRTDRASWATVGLSSGGWCAAMAAMLHPAQYGASMVFGGYFTPQFSGYVPFAKGTRSAQRYDLTALVRRDPPPLAVWMETSHSDGLSYPSSSLILKTARAPLSIQAVVLTHAGHRISLWQGLLPQALAWLGHEVPGFAA